MERERLLLDNQFGVLDYSQAPTWLIEKYEDLFKSLKEIWNVLLMYVDNKTIIYKPGDFHVEVIFTLYVRFLILYREIALMIYQGLDIDCFILLRSAFEICAKSKYSCHNRDYAKYHWINNNVQRIIQLEYIHKYAKETGKHLYGLSEQYIEKRYDTCCESISKALEKNIPTVSIENFRTDQNWRDIYKIYSKEYKDKKMDAICRKLTKLEKERLEIDSSIDEEHQGYNLYYNTFYKFQSNFVHSTTILSEYLIDSNKAGLTLRLKPRDNGYIFIFQALFHYIFAFDICEPIRSITDTKINHLEKLTRDLDLEDLLSVFTDSKPRVK